MAWMLALAAKCPSTARRANFLALAWELVLVLTKRSWVDMGSSKNRRPCGDTLRMPAGSRLGKARVDNPIKQSHAQPMGLGHSSTTSTHHDEALSRRGARELEEWQRLGAILDRSGTQGLVDDWMMGEAYGLPPIIVGRQLMEWLRTQLEPNSMADIDRLDAILYIRNPSRLRGVFFQESLAQTVRGGPVNLRALRWAQFIHQEDPECAAAALVDGQWARQAFGARLTGQQFCHAPFPAITGPSQFSWSTHGKTLGCTGKTATLRAWDWWRYGLFCVNAWGAKKPNFSGTPVGRGPISYPGKWRWTFAGLPSEDKLKKKSRMKDAPGCNQGWIGSCGSRSGEIIS